MKHEEFKASSGDTRHALKFGSQKINLHKSDAEFEPKAKYPTPGSADLCFITKTSVDELLTKLHDARVHVEEGGKVVERTGATGGLKSIYLRDPDHNLVEYVVHNIHHGLPRLTLVFRISNTA
jgi:catechol 2,3-dioxygenase-like lactoylglutathione lyase family enzyme